VYCSLYEETLPTKKTAISRSWALPGIRKHIICLIHSGPSIEEPKSKPIPSMYGISITYIWLIFMVNVNHKYSSPMGAVGNFANFKAGQWKMFPPKVLWSNWTAYHLQDKPMFFPRNMAGVTTFSWPFSHGNLRVLPKCHSPNKSGLIKSKGY